MGYICCLILLSLAVWSRKFNKSNTSLVFIFIVFWFLIVLGSLFRCFNLYSIPDFIYTLVLLGSIFFCIGYSVGPRTKRLLNSYEVYDKVPDFTLLYYVILGGAIIIIIKQISLILPLLLVHGMADSRTEMQLDDSLVLSGGWDVLIGYFGKPFVKATIVIIIVKMFLYKPNIKQIAIVLILSCLYFFSEGGRAMIMDIFYICAYLLLCRKNNISLKYLKRLKAAMIIFAMLPILATWQRGSSVLTNIYMYYCGSLQFLSQVFDKHLPVLDHNTLGQACFQGFTKPIFGILQLLGIRKPEIINNANEFILNSQDIVEYVSPTEYLNYYMTCFGYAYKDGGFLAVCIILFLYGLICRKFDNLENSHTNNLCVLSYKVVLVYTLFFTMAVFPFALHIHTLTLLYIYIITRYLMSHTKSVTLTNNSQYDESIA